MSALRAPPVEPGDDGRFDPESIHQGDRVEGERRLLAVADRLSRKEARRSEAAEVGDDHPVAGRRQERNSVDVAVDVVRPAVEQDDRRPVDRPPVEVPDVQGAGIDLADGASMVTGSVATDASRPDRHRRGRRNGFQDHVRHGFRLRDHDDVGAGDLRDLGASALRHRAGHIGAGGPVSGGNDGPGRQVLPGRRPVGSEKASSDTGRWVAAISAACSSERSPTNVSGPSPG